MRLINITCAEDGLHCKVPKLCYISDTAAGQVTFSVWIRSIAAEQLVKFSLVVLFEAFPPQCDYLNVAMTRLSGKMFLSFNTEIASILAILWTQEN